jgi:Cu(I)/Ag(I) efflux system membrane protein CusA/SilA
MAVEVGTLRVRPLAMTMATDVVALMPVMFATGPGADVAKRIASPLWGGLVSLGALTLFVVPALWVVWRGRRRPAAPAAAEPVAAS